MKLKLLLGTTVCLSAFLVAHAQRSTPSLAGSVSAEVAGHKLAPQALEQWRAEHGAHWRGTQDPETGFVRFLHGGTVDPSFRPGQDRDFALLAIRAIDDTQALHGIDSSTLIVDQVTFLPLAQIGSSDKMTVRLVQSFGGVEVVGGSMNVLFDLEGRLLALDNLAIPAVSSTRVNPAIREESAREAGRHQFFVDTGLPVTREHAPALRIVRDVVGKTVAPRLVWDVELHFAQDDMSPEGYHYWIDAITGELVRRTTAIHHDVSGNVESWVTPGSWPDIAANPEVLAPMAHLRVTSSQGNATTDLNGNFTITGATAPLNVTVTYDGSFVSTYDSGTSDYSQSQTLTSSSGNQVTMNAATTALYTAEANCFFWINNLRDWTRAINPSDSTCDFLAQSNVNINSSCNAYYDGSSVNFYQAGGGCVNTGFSSVVVHEMGHWLNDLYGSGNDWNGFGEGNADAYGIYILDDPVVGAEWQGPGTYVRHAENNTMFCGDSNQGCHGGLHADGEVLMGALWQVRTRLKTQYGVTAGGLIADTLHNSWMNAYDDSTIITTIEEHWLALDDNDGNISNGTPNYPYIDGGFMDQGFPGYGLTFVDVQNVTTFSNTPYETGPFTVTADLTAPMNPPVSAANLIWRVNNGGWSVTPMSFVSGTTYTADIPTVPNPSNVQYYVQGEDSFGNPGSFPTNAPVGLLGFLVGVEQIYYFEDFENGVAGWTHGASAGVDDWRISSAVGSPNGSYGKAGDPTSAYSGTNIWGTDLGAGTQDGEYEDDTSSWLHSPSLDLSSAAGAKLTFQRWLKVEKGTYDQARVSVNGTLFWENESGTDHTDTAWHEMEFDISSVADGNSNVELQWTLDTDYSVTYGGWNIDDVQVSATVATVYAAAVSRNGAGTNPANFTTVTNPVLGTPWQSRVDGGSVGFSGTTFLFLYGAGLPGSPSVYGEILLDPSSAMLRTLAAPIFAGFANFSIDVPPDVLYHGMTASAQCYMHGAPWGTQLTNALDVTLGY